MLLKLESMISEYMLSLALFIANFISPLRSVFLYDASYFSWCPPKSLNIACL